jgi:hypothetical protein
MSAIDGKDLKLISFDVAHPASDLGGFTIPSASEGILVRCQSGLPRRVGIDCAQLNPGVVTAFASDWSKKKTDYRNCDGNCDHSVQQDANLHQETATGHSFPFWTRLRLLFARCVRHHNPPSLRLVGFSALGI